MDFEKLADFELSKGGHDTPEDGLCAMEAVAWLEGEPHSDKPECACPAIASFVRGMNDRLSDDGRQRLIVYLPKIVGTKTDNATMHERVNAAVNVAEKLEVRRLPDEELDGPSDIYDIGWLAADNLPTPEALAILDDLLAIGAPSPGFSTDVEARVSEYRALIDAA